jgi:peptide/nickel transport system permease protein
VSVIIFLVTQALPGSAASMLLGPHSTEENIQYLEEQMGLDKPVYIQYLDWLFGLVTLSWGRSLIHNAPIVEVMAPRLIRSLELALVSLSLIVFLGIPLGVIAAIKANSIIDTFVTTSAYVGVSLPSFVTGILLIFILAGPTWNIFPSSGYVPRSQGIIPWLMHLALPALTLSIVGTAHTLRQTRTGMLEALSSEYVRTARLKGMKELDVVVKHAMRNGLIATVTVIALALGWLMGSIVVVEEVFAYPGLGRLLIQAIQSRDLPVVQFSVLIIAATYTVANLAADIIYTYLDPRIEYN